MSAAGYSAGLKGLSVSRVQRLGKELAWIVLGNAAVVLGALVGIRVLTEFLDPRTYGELALGLTLATLVSQTVMGPLSNGASRFYAPAAEKGELGAYLGAVRQLVLWSAGLIAGLMLLALAGLWASGRTEWLAVAAAACVFAALTGCNSTLSGMQNAARQRVSAAIHQGLESWGRFLIAAGLTVFLGATSAMAMVGYAVAASLVLVSQYVFFRRGAPAVTGGRSQPSEWRQQIWRYSWPFATWGIFAWGQQVSDRWALGLFSGTREVGLYAVLFQLGYYPIAMASGMIMQFIGPILYARAGDATDERRNAEVARLSRQLSAFTLGLTALAVGIALLWHTVIFRIFAAAEYASVSHLLPWMLLAGGVFAAAQIISLNLMSQMKTHAMTRAKIVTALGGILCNFAGAYLYGATGIVVANILFSVSYLVWMHALSRA